MISMKPLRNFFAHLTLIVVLASSVACSKVAPFRTSIAADEWTSSCPMGNPDSGGSGSVINEKTDAHALYYVEFDDQGQPYRRDAGYGDAATQVDLFLCGVRSRLKNSDDFGHPAAKPKSKVSVVVFIHGWKHSSESGDPNIQWFSQILDEMNSVEKSNFGCGRKVVGLYVGWRCAGSLAPRGLLENMTFWSRKNTASFVAQGGINEIVARLKAMQDINSPRTSVRTSEVMPENCEDPLRLTYIGHSFGGLILYLALAPTIMNDVAFDHELLTENPRAQLPVREYSLILLNPAIESARFDALYRLVVKTPYSRYMPPLLVSLTSQDDLATRKAFPLGRILNTVTKQFPRNSAQERKSTRSTIGHDDQYVTHELTEVDRDESADRGAGSSTCEAFVKSPQEKLNVRSEAEARKFLNSMGPDMDIAAALPRLMTVEGPYGAADERTLSLRTTEIMTEERNSPIWNIHTSTPVICNHGNLNNPRLIAFLRQLYVDRTMYPDAGH